ncbi:hypothetical protein PC9H_002147 [Pleurotus ostreatus]|uniref:Uncharacterized protein n=1 Tax=Pleurotus ostreatus TaxID=5322 RepID=A0A8H7DQ72_PLEOS|nr:uncharacterized protein PC9H_002147 [Pleurotus ostreatus]KAF7419556.1 hypothetical protein PC9H_002147 [Pleurotus ostreatus]
MPKFGHQQQIGASGSWWQFRLERKKSSFRPFDLSDYTQEFLDDSHESDDEGDDLPESGLDVITSPDEAATRKKHDEIESARREAAAKERALHGKECVHYFNEAKR